MPAADPAPKVDVYMPWFVSDYLTSTALFSAEEHGVYSLLLMHMWTQGGTLPLEHDRLARVGRISDPERWAAIWQVISVKFMPAPDRPGHITQRRLDEELENARALKVAATDRGRAGADARWGKGRKPRQPEPAPAPMPGHVPKHCSSNALQSPPPSDPDPERADPPEDPGARAIPDGGPEPEQATTYHHGVVRARGQPGLVPNPAHAGPPPDPLEPRARRMLELFSRVRIEVGKERGLTVLPWNPSDASVEKALALMRRLQPDRAAQADVEPTMRLYLKRMSYSGNPKDRDPDWVFPCWAQRFAGLREEVEALRKRTARAGPQTGQQVLAAWAPKEAWPPKGTDREEGRA